MRVEKTLVILNRLGLHARAATKLVQAAQRFASEIHITKDGTTVNCKSIMGVLMLAAAKGTTITICAQGNDAEAAVQALTALVAARFGEKE